MSNKMKGFFKMNRREKEMQARRMHIIKNAATIFGRDGYENASVNEIAKEAEFTKRTLYKYFNDKADLYLSVLLFKYRQMIDHFENQELKGTTGFEKLRDSIEKQYKYYLNNTDTFRIMYDIGNVREVTDNEKINEFIKLDSKITETICSLIELGQKDGSIANEPISEDMTVSLKFILSAVFDKLAIVGDSYVNHIEKSKDDFIKDVIDMILDSIKKTKS